MVIQNLINIFQEDNKENKIRSVVSKDKLSIEFVIPYIFESKGKQEESTKKMHWKNDLIHRKYYLYHSLRSKISEFKCAILFFEVFLQYLSNLFNRNWCFLKYMKKKRMNSF